MKGKKTPPKKKKADCECCSEHGFREGYMAMRVQNKDDLYYDALEAVDMNDYVSAEEMLLRAKTMDPEYVQTYIGLVSVYARPKDRKKAVENICIAYEKTLKQFPKWPKRMEWGFLENRAYLRAIQYRADIFWDERDHENAEALFRLLLRLNPNDNQGVRYEIAALFAGISGRELNRMIDEGNAKQNWNKLEKLVSVQNKRHVFWKEPR